MKNKKQGISLIETILYIGIAASIFLIISFFFPLLLKERVKNQSIREVEQQGMIVMNEMTKTIRNSVAVNSPAKGATNIVLSLQVDTPAKNPTVFSVSNNTLFMTEGSSLAVPLTSTKTEVKNLVFKNVAQDSSPATIQIVYTLDSKNLNVGKEYFFTKNFQGSASLKK